MTMFLTQLSIFGMLPARTYDRFPRLRLCRHFLNGTLMEVLPVRHQVMIQKSC